MIRTPNDKIYDFKNRTIIIICCNGEKVLIDYDDDILIKGKRIWVDTGYAKLKINGKCVRLHNIILPHKEDLVVDHKNRDKMDCRKSNLKLCTRLENDQNKSLYKNNSTGCPGLFLNKKTLRFVVYISRYKIKYYLGSFKTKQEAISAYNKKAAEFKS